MTTLATDKGHRVAAPGAGLQEHLVERAAGRVRRCSYKQRKILRPGATRNKSFDCLAQKLGACGEIDHALQVGLGKGNHARGPLDVDKYRVFLGIDVRTPGNGLLGVGKGRDLKLRDL